MRRHRPQFQEVMKVTIASHCAIDTVHLQGSVYEQPGGDACYSGLAARQFGADVFIQTRFGSDFPDAYLSDPRIQLEGAGSETPTTRFEIRLNGIQRDLYLRNECEAISAHRITQDGIIITPIYHELDAECIVDQDGYVLLNPQGMLRRAGADGLVETVPADIPMDGVDALKVNPTEIRALTGKEGDAGLNALHKKGVETILRTNGKSIDMYHEGMVYSLHLPNKEIFDTTGLGAILCGVFVCTMLREKDPLWAFCFAGGAVQAALDTKALGLLKIPKRGAVQTNASYFYNLVEYRKA